MMQRLQILCPVHHGGIAGVLVKISVVGLNEICDIGADVDEEPAFFILISFCPFLLEKDSMHMFKYIQCETVNESSLD